MAKEDKKVSRKRFDEIMGVAKRHHLAKLLKDNEDDEDFEVSDLRYAMEECGPAFIKLGQLLGRVRSCIYQIRSAIGFFGFLISAILGIYIIIKFIRTEK